jgi:hypothetical protein
MTTMEIVKLAGAGKPGNQSGKSMRQSLSSKGLQLHTP